MEAVKEIEAVKEVKEVEVVKEVKAVKEAEIYLILLNQLLLGSSSTNILV